MITMAIDNKDKKVLKSSIEREQNEVACSAECEKIKGSKNLNVPPLRFPEFSGEWEKRTLEDVSEFSKERMNTQNLSSDNYVATENMLHDYQGIIEASSVPTNTNVIKFNKGDVLLSNIRPYLKKVWFADKNGGCSADVFVFKALSACIPDFLHYIIANDRFINFAMSGAKGVKMPRGDKEQMKTYEIGLPSIEEQKKIAKLLSLLDERITTQNKIIEDLKKLKSAIRKRVFTSLKNEHTESCEINQLLAYEQPTAYIVANNEYSTDTTLTPVLTANKGFVLGYTDEDSGIYQKGECIIFDDFTMDAKYVSFPFKVKSSAIKILTAKPNVNLRFMFEYLSFLGLKSEEHKRHYISEIASLVIELPSKEKQNIIANLMTSLDNKLALKEKAEARYEAKKRYLLSQMFI